MKGVIIKLAYILIFFSSLFLLPFMGRDDSALAYTGDILSKPAYYIYSGEAFGETLKTESDNASLPLPLDNIPSYHLFNADTIAEAFRYPSPGREESVKTPDIFTLDFTSADESEDTQTSNLAQNFVLLTSYQDNDVARNEVEKHIYLYTTRQRSIFAKWLERSGKYIEAIINILKKGGLPEGLVYLPLIESGFNTLAQSKSLAVGPWQFIETTAKQYGLKIDYWRDERRDPIKSTHAAGQYLNDLYNRFGSWPLTLAAYNAGEGKIMRALQKTQLDSYWDLIRTRYLKRETRDYVPKFIAAGIIASDPEKYGFSSISYHPPMKFEEVEIKMPASLEFIAKCSSNDLRVIRELNPELKRWCTPPNLENYKVRILEGTGDSFFKCFNMASPKERMSKIPYFIQIGDTLHDIAMRFKVPRNELYALNKGGNLKRLISGSVIYLPPTADLEVVRKLSREEDANTNIRALQKVPYTIKKGDTLYDIAIKFNVHRKRLYDLNKGINPNRLKPGSIIYIPHTI